MLGTTPSHPSEAHLVTFSSILKGKAIKLNDNGLIANGDKGYRSVLGTQGVSEGVYYYEIRILNPSCETLNFPSQQVHNTAPMLEPLIASYDMMCLDTHDSFSISYHSAHTRIGFATANFDTEMPVGSELTSYSYRDIDGAVFNDGRRTPYAEPYGPNDVIGCLISLRPQKPIVKGQVRSSTVVSENSEIYFFKNGVNMGVAFRHIFEGTYYPAVAVYQFARVEINMQGPFSYPQILSEFQAKPFSP
mmetsp:Transcript_26884/g.48457  ORF Transcript_26884/g.48457 Transcript_26884/m.48457 type:complete len:247 (-) Transcript_26884:143-883(-)